MERLTYWNKEIDCWSYHGPSGEVAIRLAAYEDALTLERAQELAQAEKDGRLVVLPDAKYTDADGEKALQKAMWVCGNTNNPVTRYTADAIAEKLCREAMDENPPLTMEQLLEMDGEPVWCVDGYGNACWCLVNCDDGLPFCYDNETGLWDGSFYGMSGDGEYGLHKTGWLAYRRKPEEGTT